MECALEARTKDEEYSVNIKLNERTYDEKELEEVFRKGKEWLDKVWLGENVSSDQVVSDLYFPMVIETLGLNVRWETSNYNWIQTDGSITELPAVYAGQVVNTVGAGDALFSGFLHFYAKGYAPLDALHRAQVFAAHKIMANGASNGFISEGAVEDFVSHTGDACIV